MATLPTAPEEIRNPIDGLVFSRPRRSWRHKFRDALRGLKLGVRGHSSFFVHFFFAALVVAAALVLHCRTPEWCILLGCIGMVFTAELFNSAIETIFRGLEEATKPRVRACLDIAAGAVLVASIVAALIGSIIFLDRLMELFGRAPDWLGAG
ncbi:MAG TPA: diacylglycerol kinase [Gemmataceae bacterium]|nr:diacylglycerol kinase [Gemmataceae bacterium]